MQNENGAVDTPINNEDEVVIVDTYDVEALKKVAAEALAQKKHWREKALKLEQRAKDGDKDTKEKPKLIEENPVKKDEPKEETSKVNPFDLVADNLSVLRGLEDDEVSELRKTAQELGVDPVRFIKSNAGQAQLKEMRQTKQTQQGTPAPSNKVITFNGKPARSVLTDEKASSQEKQAAYEAMLKGRRLNQSQ